jgi:L-lactate dehydrogenase complex protein LldG
MGARENILKAIAVNQPAWVELPVIDTAFTIGYEDSFTQFKTILESIGGKVELIWDVVALKEQLSAEKISGNFVINTIKELGDVDQKAAFLPAFELEKVQKAYVKGTVGVAENGAVWIYESQMINRLVPFICQHLILVIEKKNIVENLHQAYAKIDVSKEGFGVFIAGPSKTADIEQSLVIGAHGARSTTIYVVQ